MIKCFQSTKYPCTTVTRLITILRYKYLDKYVAWVKCIRKKNSDILYIPKISESATDDVITWRRSAAVKNKRGCWRTMVAVKTKNRWENILRQMTAVTLIPPKSNRVRQKRVDKIHRAGHKNKFIQHILINYTSMLVNISKPFSVWNHSAL